jgi:hypothetical protein
LDIACCGIHAPHDFLMSQRIVQYPYSAMQNLVFGFAKRGDSVPLTFNHFGELLGMFQPVPRETSTSLVIDCIPIRSTRASELSEGLLAQIGGIEPLIGHEQSLPHLSAIQRQLAPERQQRITSSLDEKMLVALQ